MCMSPHEMTSARIEEDLEWMRQPENIKWWEGRIEDFEKLLKERAEDGTYATAGF